MTNGITIESVGRRHYLRGNTYPLKDRIRSAGCKWDSDAKAWYSGKRETVEQLVAALGAGTAVPASAPDSGPGSERPAPGEDAKVAGRATYKGRTYYVAGRVVRGRTHWDDRVEAVSTRDDAKVLLHFRDGSRSFWAPRVEVQIVKRYDRAKTIRSLREYAEQAKHDRETGTCSCRCHSEHNAGAPGSTLYDGCDRCGCEAC